MSGERRVRMDSLALRLKTMFRVCDEINSSALESHMNSNDDKQSGQLLSHKSSILTAKT